MKLLSKTAKLTPTATVIGDANGKGEIPVVSEHLKNSELIENKFVQTQVVIE